MTIKDFLEKNGLNIYKNINERFNELKDQFIEMAQLKSNLDIEKLEMAASKLRAIAHPMRIAIIDLLNDKQLSVTEIYENLSIEQASTHALVGESGSGKSVTALSVLRLLEDISRVSVHGRILFNERDILSLDKDELLSVRGNQISMIFQEPMTSLNPVYTIGNQLLEPLLQHQGLSRDQAEEKAIQLLERTGITQPEYRINSYPHQLSGGQRQRVMIAMALACRPDLLIADEPTTALDVTIQEQILELIQDLQKEYRMAVMLITHDLPMVKKYADTVSIMYDGRICRARGYRKNLFRSPA